MSQEHQWSGGPLTEANMVLTDSGEPGPVATTPRHPPPVRPSNPLPRGWGLPGDSDGLGSTRNSAFRVRADSPLIEARRRDENSLQEHLNRQLSLSRQVREQRPKKHARRAVAGTTPSRVVDETPPEVNSPPGDASANDALTTSVDKTDDTKDSDSSGDCELPQSLHHDQGRLPHRRALRRVPESLSRQSHLPKRAQHTPNLVATADHPSTPRRYYPIFPDHAPTQRRSRRTPIFPSIETVLEQHAANMNPDGNEDRFGQEHGGEAGPPHSLPASGMGIMIRSFSRPGLSSGEHPQAEQAATEDRRRVAPPSNANTSAARGIGQTHHMANITMSEFLQVTEERHRSGMGLPSNEGGDDWPLQYASDDAEGDDGDEWVYDEDDEAALEDEYDGDKRRPTPLDLTHAQRYGEHAARNRGLEAVHHPMAAGINTADASASSYYGSQQGDQITPISPLHIFKTRRGDEAKPLEEYSAWKTGRSPLPQLSGGGSSSIPKAHTTGEVVVPNSSGGRRSSPFSPLTPWLEKMESFIGGGGDANRKSKKLFGKDGWLEDTAAQNKKDGNGAAEVQQSKKMTAAHGLLDAFKKKAKEAKDWVDKQERKMGIITSNGALDRSSKERGGGHVPPPTNVSLTTREQSLLYCELEYALSNALDEYIKTQLNGARLDPDKLAKVSEGWARKGRPRVLGFRYDLETQVELVMMHAGDFRFYGDTTDAEDYHDGITTTYEQQQQQTAASTSQRRAAIWGLLHAMRANARCMRVRTFCQPDPVVAKHILDSQALLRLLDSPASLQVSLAEISQFFKVVVEREKAVRREAEAASRRLARQQRKQQQEQQQAEEQQKMLGRGQGHGPDTTALGAAVAAGAARRGGAFGGGMDGDEAARQFSGPVLQPTVYDPTADSQKYRYE